MTKQMTEQMWMIIDINFKKFLEIVSCMVVHSHVVEKVDLKYLQSDWWSLGSVWG